MRCSCRSTSSSRNPRGHLLGRKHRVEVGPPRACRPLRRGPGDSDLGPPVGSQKFMALSLFRPRDPRRSCPHRSVLAASSSEPPRSVGLAHRPVGAWRRHLVKQLGLYEESPRARAHVIDGGLAAVRASGAVYAVDNGLSDSPCQIRFRRVRIARTMEESAGLTRLRKGAGDESEGGRLPGGQGHDYRTA